MRFLRRLHVRKAVLVAALLLLAGWLIPPFVHISRYRRVLRSALENQLGRPVELGAVTLRLLPHPGFSIQNVLVREDPRFGSEPLARIGSVECGLRWLSLWSSRLSCSRIVLNHPVVNAVRNASGDWNLEEVFRRQNTVPKRALADASSRVVAPFDFEADDARINFTVNGTKKPFALDRVRARLEFNPSRGPVEFRIQGTPVRTDLALRQPPGQVVVTGEWKPEAGFNGPFRARLSTSDSLLYAWIPLLAHRDPGIYGLVSANIVFEGSARQVRAEGTLRVSQLHRWESLPPSSSAPLNVAFSSTWDRADDRVDIRTADATFSGSRVHLAGRITQLLRAPNLDLAVALKRASVEDLIRMGNSLARHPLELAASGRVEGDLRLEGPWSARRYGGVLSLRSLALKDHGVELQSREAEIHIDEQGAHLLPARFTVGPGIEAIAEGNLYPALPGGARYPGASPGPRRQGHGAEGHAVAARRYNAVLTFNKIPLHAVVRLARTWGVRGLRDLSATGEGEASVRLSGAAWPFTRPEAEAQGHLNSARLFVAGLTEPVRLSRFRFRFEHGVFTASEVDAGIGGTAFFGWLERDAGAEPGWQFAAHAPHLSLEQASLWFTVLGYQRPRPILDLIPGLRSLEGSRTASRNLFATIDARGSFESPDVTFRSLTIKNFHAGIAITNRVARVSSATFLTGAGKGAGSAVIDFKRAPASIAAQFKLSGLRVQQFASSLPTALSGVRGVLSAAVRLTTRGLTRQEMAAHLEGAAQVRCQNVNFAGFDPVGAVAQAASLGVLAPERRAPTIPQLDFNVTIRGKNVDVAPASLLLSGAALGFEGKYGFDGMANFLVSADLDHVNRRWLIDAPESGPQGRVVRLHLRGGLQNLKVVPAGDPTTATR